MYRGHLFLRGSRLKPPQKHDSGRYEPDQARHQSLPLPAHNEIEPCQHHRCSYRKASQAQQSGALSGRQLLHRPPEAGEIKNSQAGPSKKSKDKLDHRRSHDSSHLTGKLCTRPCTQSRSLASNSLTPALPFDPVPGVYAADNYSQDQPHQRPRVRTRPPFVDPYA